MRVLRSSDRLRCTDCPAVTECVVSAIRAEDRHLMHRELRFILYQDEEVIFHQGTAVWGTHILCRGLVKLRFVTPDGNDLLIRFCTPGEILTGIASREHAFSAVAVGSSTVGIISRVRTKRLIERYPQLESEIEHRFAYQGKLLLQRMADLAYESVEERLIHILLSLEQRHGVYEENSIRIDIPLSQQDLAEMIGASRQAVNRELRKLAENGLIRMERRQITIVDEQALRNLK